jgi:hypothetical protein
MLHKSRREVYAGEEEKEERGKGSDCGLLVVV